MKVETSEVVSSEQMSVATTVSDKIGYNSHVRPILSDKCFACHGPDEPNNKAGLRLDTPEAAYSLLKDSTDTHAIVPGDLAKSDIWARIISDDPDKVMPTPESNLVLTETEKEIIKRWIEEGAKYEPHWAFVQLPEETPVPDTGGEWSRNEIDAFVAEKLTAEGLEPAKDAEPLRWLRRVTFSLIGLPPTPDEVEAFAAAVENDGEAAYEAVVDRLLASPQYGKHMAIDWLDAARYADTLGYHSDMDFTPWPYRDWVVDVFNEDMPFNDFVTWNLAGDLLQNATKEQKLATAFNRLHRITNEGGSNHLEFFVDGVADRLQTVGTAMMGMTMECARCHDHKYDPISQKDYFTMFAFFNSINETGVYNHGAISPPPSLLLPTESQEEKYSALKSEATSLEQQIADAKGALDAQFQQWKANLPAEVELVDHAGYFSLDGNDGLTNIYGAPERPDIKDEKKRKKAESPAAMESRVVDFVDGVQGQGVTLNGDDGLTIPYFYLTDRYDPMSISLWIKDTLREKGEVALVNRFYGHDVGYNGWGVMLDGGHVEARVFRAWPDNGIGVRSVEPVPQDKWAHLTWVYDGSGKAKGLKLYLDGVELATEVTGDKLWKSVSVKTYQPGDVIVGAKFRGRGFKGGSVDEVHFFERAITPLEIQSLMGQGSLASASDEELRDYYFSAINPETRALQQQLVANYKAITKAEDDFIEVPVMEELDEPRDAWVLSRGDFNAPRTDENKVGRDTLHFLQPFPEDAPRDRRGFAQWLTDPSHPLLTRVHVNRLWALFFGNGLVGTAENFGLQGDLPTHPELLDWLARDFINSGWSQKALMRKIALSSTFRQDSRPTAELLERDIDNKLLARGPAYRLSGEQVRDMALASSGLLREKDGGAPVRPYDPKHNTDPKLDQVHRRSLYSYWRRTKPIPNMIAFDKPSLEVCSVKRTRTNSPAQALVLLNDVQFVEAARALATDLPEGNDREKLAAAWTRVTGQIGKERELQILQEILEDQRAYFKADSARADKLLKVGLAPLPEGVDPVETAAMTVACQAIYNSDAAIWKR